MLDKNKVKRWHDFGLWTSDMVLEAVQEKELTQNEADEILGGEKNE